MAGLDKKFKKKSMNTEDQLASTPSVTKRPISRKNQILTHNQTTGLSRLPTFLSKSSSFLSTSDTMHFKRYRPKQKESLNSSSLKFERQTINMNFQARLPPLNTTSNDNKQRSDYHRRQIYALNHLMRELEQEQFREFCKLNSIGIENTEEILLNEEEDPNKQLTNSE